MQGVVRPRGRLFWKYVVLFAGLVSAALLASGLVELYFSYRENLAALVALQREQAAGAAGKIEAFLRDIERQVGWASQGQVGTRQTVEQRRFEFIRLQRQAPAVTEVSQLDPQGREQLRVSRLAMDVVGSQADFASDPRFKDVRPGRPYFGPVYFRKESEPYLTLSVAGGGDTGVTVAEVNLKFIWDVVSQIRIGSTGHAYVVDGRGQLVAHPDISLVLQKTDLSRLDQVRAALAGPPAPGRAGPEGHRRPGLRRAPGPDGVGADRAARLVGLRRAAARRGARAPLRVRLPHRRAPPRRRRAVGPGEPPPGAAHDDPDPRARGGRGADRRGRARPADRREDRRRARGARRPVQPHGGPAPRVVRHPRAEGRGPDARAHRGARAPDGDGRDPAGHLELADRHPAGARHRRGAGHAALRGGRRGRPADRGRVHADRRAPRLDLRPGGRGHAAGRSAGAARDAPHGENRTADQPGLGVGTRGDRPSHHSRGRPPGRGRGVPGRGDLRSPVRPPHHAGDAPHARGRSAGGADGAAERGAAVHRQAGQAPRDLRRPGGDRDRERPPVPGARAAEPRARRGARAADRDRGDPAASSRARPPTSPPSSTRSSTRPARSPTPSSAPSSGWKGRRSTPRRGAGWAGSSRSFSGRGSIAWAGPCSGRRARGTRCTSRTSRRPRS